jgi:2'-5' RNA ligase
MSSIRDIGTFGVGPKKARVVYARVRDGTDTIQKLTHLVVTECVKAKLVRPDKLSHIDWKNELYSLEQIHVTMFKSNESIRGRV